MTFRRVLLALLSAAALAAAAWGALFTAFFASITWSGCFIECTGTDEGNHLEGLLLGLLAAGFLAAGPLAVAALYRSRVWLRATGWTGLAGVVGAFVVLAAS